MCRARAQGRGHGQVVGDIAKAHGRRRLCVCGRWSEEGGGWGGWRVHERQGERKREGKGERVSEGETDGRTDRRMEGHDGMRGMTMALIERDSDENH